MTDESAKFGKSFGTAFSSEQSSVKDLLDRCLAMTGINKSDPLWRTRALAMMDVVYKQALKGRHWKFSHKEAYMNFEEPYIAGTLDLIQDSYTVEESVASGASPVIKFNPATMPGQILHVTNSEERFYRIASTKTKSLEITAKYSEASNGFGSYEILFDRLKLDPKIQQVKSVLISGFTELRPLGQQEFRELQHTQAVFRKGVPQCYTYGEFEQQASSMHLEVYPAPDQRYPIQIDYVERPVSLADSGTCFPLIPREHDDVLQYGTMREIYRQQNNEAQRKSMNTDYLISWTKMASDQEMTDSTARIAPKKNYFAMPLIRAGKRGRGRRRRFDSQ